MRHLVLFFWVAPVTLLCLSISLGVLLSLPIMCLLLIGIPKALVVIISILLFIFALLLPFAGLMLGFFKSWYYSWVFANYAVQMMPLLLGLALIVGFFYYPFTLLGGLALTVNLALLFVNHRVRRELNSTDYRERFAVNQPML